MESDVTLSTTITAATQVVTVTVGGPTETSMETSTPVTASVTTESTTVQPLTASSTTSSAPAPTGTAITCPEANNSTVQQMVGQEVFEYTILCGAIFGDSDFYAALNFDTFSECISACSIGDNAFDYAVCQGVSYYANVPASSGGNCHLKTSANQTFGAPGIDSAILTRVKVAVSNSPSGGTSAQAVGFDATSPTMNPQQVSSSMSSVLSNSSMSMPMITPKPLMMQSGLLVNNPLPFTAFSTYISDGSTFSSGTVTSFATTYPNGSWISYYYSSYTEKWTAATEVFGATATGYTLANSTNSESSEQPADENGDYTIITNTTSTEFTPTGYNVTEVVSNQTYASNGSEIHSTATTYRYSVQTAGGGSGGVAGGGSGGAAGGAASGAAGSPASTSAGTVTSTYSTQTIIFNSGATGGASSTMLSGGPPSTTESGVTNTHGTGFSFGTAISGQISVGGTGGASGIAASGGPGGAGGQSAIMASGGPSSTSLSLVTVITSAGGTGGASGFTASGGPRGAGGQTIVIASGGPSSSTGTFSNGNGLRSGELPSGSSSTPTPYGSPGATGGQTMTMASGGRSPSTGTFSNGYGLRSGELPSGFSSASMGPSATAPSPYGGSSPSSSISNSESGLPRSGTYSTTSSPSGTGPVGYGGPSPSNSPSSSVSISGLPRSGTYSTTTTPSVGPVSTGPSTGSPLPSNGTMSSTTAYRPPYQPHYGGPLQPYPGPPAPSSLSGTGSVSSPSGTFTNSGYPRSPYPPGSSSTLAPSGPTSCGNGTVGTTTVFTTITEYGCYSSCAPSWGGYYGGGGGGEPQAFGPPVFATPTTTASQSATM